MKRMKRGENMRRHHGHRRGFMHRGYIMSLEEEIEMLEKAKEHANAMLKNINERLEKLKE